MSDSKTSKEELKTQVVKSIAEDIHKIENGPTLILAGPGTGKTHRMALRVKWLVEEMHCNPNEITIITFTTEAALNMRHRLSNEEKKDVYMPLENRPILISTMHSLGQQIITGQIAALNLTEDFKISPQSDSLRKLIFEDAAQIEGLERAKGPMAFFAKQKAIRINDDKELAPIHKKYDQILNACNSIDFDDQLIIACSLLQNNKELLESYQRQAKHLLVDEFQDINRYQFEMIKLLAGKNANGLFVVGDDDQSIYSFRGGSPEYVRKFTDYFGDKVNIRHMNECWRCPPAVLDAAVAVVKKFNPDRALKPDLSSLKKIENQIQYLDSPTQDREASEIASKCSQVSASHDVLILVPNINFAKPIVKALRKKRISFDCKSIISYGGFDLLNNLGDWLDDPSSSFALRELINFLLEAEHYEIPSSRVRKSELINLRDKKLSEISFLWKSVIEKKCSLFEALAINKDTSPVLSKLYETLNELISMHKSPPANFLSTIGSIMYPWATPNEMFHEISIWLTELRGQATTGKANVRIMTMSMAKGLEADYVFVIGLDEQIFPKSNISADQLQENSRLAYVSMTRAEIELWLCHARTRSSAVTFLPESFALKESPFVTAIPKKLININYKPNQDASKKKKASI